ncbi:MAG: methylase [Clostridium sp.]|nr:methylase [Clostridium sp.]
MTEMEQRAAATKFYNDWRGKGDEKSDSQRFWIEFLGNVLGIRDITQKIIFEKRVMVDGQVKFIDAYIPETRVLIEQKSIDKDLNKKILQSDGSMRTPFEQGRNYAQWMIPNETPLWIVACNFKSFEVHDMNKPSEPPVIILLEEVRNKLPLFDFMFKKDIKELSHEMEISVKAGAIVGLLYDKLIMQYKEPNEQSFKSLNALCVRLVFCLYAEDAGIFGSHMMFHDYLKDIPVNGFRKALVELFKVLDTKVEDRDKYLAEDNPQLAAFPYVNGGLFADETIEIPPFTEEIKNLLLDKASADFDWSDISPTIFGAVFESTLNPETRRKGGMHYTSIENIHKVIDPLFLDDLQKEFNDICEISVVGTRKKKLKDFQTKLASLSWLDPACGSGNFLTETYLSIRRLENDVLRILEQGQISFDIATPIKVSISQFYGIEINDFAVTVAKTALWIAESQMMKQTEDIVNRTLDFLPLKTYANITEGNALQLDWESIVPKYSLNYIMGNPPFRGFKVQSPNQRKDIQNVANGKIEAVGLLDYVSGWYIKAARLMQGTKIHTAFVSTNSITQGEQPAILWKYLFDLGVEIFFAYRTFVWSSEAKIKASVHCVIIGFSCDKFRVQKRIFEGDMERNVNNISPYLIDCENILVRSQRNPLCNVPRMIAGNKTVKCLALILSQEEKEELVAKEPNAEKYIKKMIGADEFINNVPRYCLWLVDVSPTEIKKMPMVMKRVEQVRKDRLSSTDKQAHALANTPTMFRDTNNPKTALVVPLVSSERRRYIPIGYIDDSTIANNKVSIVPDAKLYHFGILTSNVHNAWMRCVAMRMKSDYSYALSTVYNTFPWCNPTSEQKKKIEETAQGILDARAKFSNNSLADLYNELLMPVELRRAHMQNDKAVMQAYGFTKVEEGKKKWLSEDECVAKLMKMYQVMTVV